MAQGIREGYAVVPGGRVYYKVVGTGTGVPLLTLHGGPGLGHDAFEPLEALASDRAVVFFDQLGCGESDQPDDSSLWQIARFAEEVKALREALGLEEVHLLGHSWGGWLAIEYLLGQPGGVRSATLYSTSASLPKTVKAQEELRQQLPPDLVQTMERCEAIGDLTDPDYEEAVSTLMARHLCRLEQPWPDCLMRSLAKFEANPVPYQTIQGPNEFVITGNLKDWDRVNRLGEITCPTLIICGQHDLLPPVCSETIHNGVAGSELHVFPDSSHSAHLEETQRFLEVVRDFLARNDSIAR